MALEHAILVSLTEQPGSGYELAHRFDRSIGFFWNATHQQIYRVLGRMESVGWLTCTVVAQQGRPDKKTYEVSEAGRDELHRWIAEPSDSAPIRSDLGVKIRAATRADDPALLVEIARHREQHQARLDLYLTIEKHDFADPSRLDDRQLHQYVVLRGGIIGERSAITWLDEITSTLTRGTR